MPKTEKENLRDKIDELKRIKVRVKSMYESGEIERSEYINKVTLLDKEIEELETKRRQLLEDDVNGIKKKQICQFGLHLVNNDLEKCPKCGLMLCSEHIMILDHNCTIYKPHEYAQPINEEIKICQFCFHKVSNDLEKCSKCGLMLCSEHIMVLDHNCTKYKPLEISSSAYNKKTFIQKIKEFLKIK